MTYRIKFYFNHHTAKITYYSCVYSVISWGGILINARKGDKLQSIQCRIVWSLFARFNHESVECIFKANKILKIVDIYSYKDNKHMFRVVVFNDSPYLKGNLELQTNEHPHNTRNRRHYKLPFTRVESIRNAYSYQFIKLWNELPGHLKAIGILRTFKTMIREDIFASY